jgi:hypothetical protein
MASAARTAYAPPVLDPLTAAKVKKLAGGWIGYADKSANQTGITTDTDLTNLSISVTVGTDRLIRITGHGVLQRSVADGVTIGYIKDGSTVIGRWAEGEAAGATSFDLHEGSTFVITTTGGGKTYKLSLERNSGTGTVSLMAAADNKAWILVEDLGPSS